MGGHLRADLDAISSASRALTALGAELSASGDIAENARGHVGAHQLNDALHSFATNWTHHRRKLVSAVDAVAAMAGDAAEVYRMADAELARSLGSGGQGTVADAGQAGQLVSVGNAGGAGAAAAGGGGAP